MPVRFLRSRRRDDGDATAVPSGPARADEHEGVGAPGGVDAALTQAQSLVDAGDPLGAVDLLQEANTDLHDPSIETRLVTLRHEAFARLDRSPGRATWPPAYPDRFPDGHGLREVRPDHLDAEVLGSALVNHGALLVRGLADLVEVAALTDGIDRAFEGFDDWRDRRAAPADTAPWFVQFKPTAGLPGKPPIRSWMRDDGGVWTADSPRMLDRLVQCFRRVRLDETLGGYFGERALLSVDKSTLRRVPVGLKNADWHQDGAFLGEGVRTVNVWLALSRCGGDTDTAGLDVVPRRLPRVLETGTEGAWFDWSVGQALVDRVAADAPVVTPLFEAGDALLFDELFLHRTAGGEHIRRERYAVESWFFAPSAYPPDYLPLVF